MQCYAAAVGDIIADYLISSFVLAIVGVQAGLAVPATVTLAKLIELAQRGIPLPALQ